MTNLTLIQPWGQFPELKDIKLSHDSVYQYSISILIYYYGAGEARSHDLRFAKPALYQLSYCPNNEGSRKDALRLSNPLLQNFRVPNVPHFSRESAVEKTVSTQPTTLVIAELLLFLFRKIANGGIFRGYLLSSFLATRRTLLILV